MKHDVLPPSQRRQLQDMVPCNHDTSLPLPSTWQEVKLPLQLPCSTIWWCRRPPRLVWHPRFHYPAGKRAPLDPILNHIKLARTIPFKAHLCMGLTTDSFSLGVSYKKKLYMHLSPKWLPPPPNNNILLWYEFRSTSLCNCLHPSLSISKYSQHPVLQHLQFTFFHLDYRWTWPTFNNCTLPSARTALTALWSLLMFYIGLLQQLHNVHTTHLCRHMHSLSRPDHT